MKIEIKKTNIYLIVLLGIVLSLIELLIFVGIDSNVINYELFSLSMLLLFILTMVFIIVENYYTPVIFFSILFYGYVFSGIYFSFYSNFDNAKLFQIVNIPFTIENLIIAQGSVIIGYIFFILGIFTTQYIKVRSVNFEFKNLNLNSEKIKIALIYLFIFGAMYWLYNSFKVANGPIDFLSKIGIFDALLKENLTTLPYHLSYIGSSLLFLHYLRKDISIPFYVYIIILVMFLMLVSNARLSGAVLYVSSFFVMYAIFHKIKIDFKKIVYVLLFFCFLLALYLLRFYSNISYIGESVSVSFFELFGKQFFGQTNIGDLQSIAFSYEYIKDEGYLLGSSFFDFTRFWIDRLLPINVDITSIGLRLKEVYFSDISGAPAPGIISEMIINFGALGYSIGMLLLGIILGLISKIIDPSQSKLNLFIYVKLLFFIFILPKVDSTSFQGFIWALLPIYLFFIITSIIYTISKGVVINKYKGSVRTNGWYHPKK